MTTIPTHSGAPVYVLKIIPAPIVCAPIIGTKNKIIIIANNARIKVDSYLSDM